MELSEGKWNNERKWMSKITEFITTDPNCGRHFAKLSNLHINSTKSILH